MPAPVIWKVSATGDPASTGFIFGIFSAVRPIFTLHEGVSLIFAPDFNEEILEGDIDIKGEIMRPILVLLTLIPFVFSIKNWVSLIKIGRRFS